MTDRMIGLLRRYAAARSNLLNQQVVGEYDREESARKLYRGVCAEVAELAFLEGIWNGELDVNGAKRPGDGGEPTDGEPPAEAVP